MTSWPAVCKLARSSRSSLLPSRIVDSVPHLAAARKPEEIVGKLRQAEDPPAYCRFHSQVMSVTNQLSTRYSVV